MCARPEDGAAPSLMLEYQKSRRRRTALGPGAVCVLVVAKAKRQRLNAWHAGARDDGHWSRRALRRRTSGVGNYRNADSVISASNVRDVLVVNRQARNLCVGGRPPTELS
jgi:hypothetical protein